MAGFVSGNTTFSLGNGLLWAWHLQQLHGSRRVWDVPGCDGGSQVPGEAAEWEVTLLHPCWSTGTGQDRLGRVQGLAGCEEAPMEIP